MVPLNVLLNLKQYSNTLTLLPAKTRIK